MKKSFFIAAAFVIILILFNTCPALLEDEYDNTIIVEGEFDVSKWLGVLQKIENEAVPVKLDLSECKISPEGVLLRQVLEDGTPAPEADPEVDPVFIEFNPMVDITIGKRYIQTLILPDAATMIPHGGPIDLEYESDEEEVAEAVAEAIEKNAFKNFSILQSVTGKNIEVIGNFAFYKNKSLTEINFSRTVQIYQYSFYGCSLLEEANFPVALNIFTSAFEECESLVKISFPDVYEIFPFAFRDCSNLTDAIFPSAEIIGDQAFRNCTKLTNIYFNAATEIGSGAFWSCASLKTAIFWASGLVDFDSSVFRGCISLITLDIRNANEVIFGDNTLANIGTSLVLYLGDSSNGHSQTTNFLGELDNNNATLKKITLNVPNSTSIEAGLALDIENIYEDTIEVVIQIR